MFTRILRVSLAELDSMSAEVFDDGCAAIDAYVASLKRAADQTGS